MPLNVKDGALLGAGMWCVAAATIFYKQKKTVPFKVAYFLSWPIMGSALLLTFMPSEERMKQVNTSRSSDLLFFSFFAELTQL